MKKKCLKKKQPGEKPSCPSKTSKKNPNPNFIKAYSKEEIDKLKKIFNSLSEKNYKDRPISLGLKTSPNIIKDDIPLLEKIFSITSFSFVTPLEIKYKEEYENNNNALKKEKEIEKEKCSICQYNFYEEEEEKISNIKKEKKFDEYLKINLNVILLDKCTDHFFHIECISMLVKNKESFKCPVCSKIYGILYGDMPDGTMKAFITENRHCSGYKDVGTIVIDYFFPGGPCYSGTYRRCYLPNTKEGKELLGLLITAFNRRLTFVIGTSVTTGRDKSIVWNGIHHKTSLDGGPTNFGYPDETYFSRVREELAMRGVLPENSGNIEKIASEMLEEFTDKALNKKKI